MESSFRVKIMQARVQTRGRKQKDRPSVFYCFVEESLMVIMSCRSM